MFRVKKLRHRAIKLEQKYAELEELLYGVKNNQRIQNTEIVRLKQRVKQLTCPHREENWKFEVLPPADPSTWRYRKVCSACGKVLDSWVDERPFYKARSEWHENQAREDFIRAGEIE